MTWHDSRQDMTQTDRQRLQDKWPWVELFSSQDKNDTRHEYFKWQLTDSCTLHCTYDKDMTCRQLRRKWQLLTDRDL